MPRFCVNKNTQSNGDHEVHDTSTDPNLWCLPLISSRVDLGYHSTCREAVTAAKAYYSRVNGCFNCARACHTS